MHLLCLCLFHNLKSEALKKYLACIETHEYLTSYVINEKESNQIFYIFLVLGIHKNVKSKIFMMSYSMNPSFQVFASLTKI